MRVEKYRIEREKKRSARREGVRVEKERVERE